MSKASWGRSLLNSSRKSSNLLCCCRLFPPAGRVVCVLSVRCMRSCRPFCCKMTGLDAFDSDAQTQPPDGELGEVEQRVGRGEGHAVVRADASGQAAFFK